MRYSSDENRNLKCVQLEAIVTGEPFFFENFTQLKVRVCSAEVLDNLPQSVLDFVGKRKEQYEQNLLNSPEVHYLLEELYFIRKGDRVKLLTDISSIFSAAPRVAYHIEAFDEGGHFKGGREVSGPYVGNHLLAPLLD